MGLKKYEIITVGSDKRVRALRSWQVGDRYVNIGDVGGIVYDEKTLSQDGACWLFRGNFGFPGARIGGDSIVDVGEAALSTTGTPAVDILGSSVVVGAPVRFLSEQAPADAVVLTADDFEQGYFNFVSGANWETWKTPSTQNIRLKAPVFMGGASKTLKLDVAGYTVQAYVLDRDGIGIAATAAVNTGAGVTLAVPAGQYMVIRLAKNPLAGIVPADATAARIKFTGTYETKLVVVDSRLELNPANSTGVITISPGGVYTITSGAKYPDSIIQNSKVTINAHATVSLNVQMMTELMNVNATIDMRAASARAVGIYHGVNNLAFTGMIATSTLEASRSLIQAYNCDNIVVSNENFPGLATMRTAGVPIRFYNCNLNNGRFYHHAQIANTYKNIDFAKASVDLGKVLSGGFLVSSEVEGMYRIYRSDVGTIGSLVESYNSISSLVATGTTYGTTIYKDAYLNGAFAFLGTNVFGNSMKHEASNTQNVMAVRGIFNATSVGGKITGIVSSAAIVCVPEPYRVNGAKGLTISNLPAGFNAAIFLTDANGVITRVQATSAANTDLMAPALVDCKAYIRFRKDSGDPITPEDLAGVTVTTYNGCKIVNTKATAAVIAGNVRVENNAALIDVSVTGTGYFGGNSIIQAPSALVGQLPIEGAAYMSDNAVFAPSSANAKAGISLLEMKDNAVFTGVINNGATGYNITMTDEARCLGVITTLGDFVMRDNSFVAESGNVVSTCRGLLAMKDDARIESGNLTTIGDITLCGKYKQTAAKTWTGKRVISSQDAPTYDGNVKTKYDI